MIDIYSIALCAITVMFGLMIALSFLLMRDQSALSARQKILETRTDMELESFREQVKTFKRSSEQQTADTNDEKEEKDGKKR